MGSLLGRSVDLRRDCGLRKNALQKAKDGDFTTAKSSTGPHC